MSFSAAVTSRPDTRHQSADDQKARSANLDRSALLLLLVDLQDQALQILGFRNIQDYRVVWSSSSSFQKTNTALRIAGGRGHHTVKFVPGHVVGAGAGHERPAWAQHL